VRRERTEDAAVLCSATTLVTTTMAAQPSSLSYSVRSFCNGAMMRNADSITTLQRGSLPGD
jgi:hypothetical protein